MKNFNCKIEQLNLSVEFGYCSLVIDYYRCDVIQTKNIK